MSHLHVPKYTGIGYFYIIVLLWQNSYSSVQLIDRVSLILLRL